MGAAALLDGVVEGDPLAFATAGCGADAVLDAFADGPVDVPFCIVGCGGGDDGGGGGCNGGSGGGEFSIRPYILSLETHFIRQHRPILHHNGRF